MLKTKSRLKCRFIVFSIRPTSLTSALVLTVLFRFKTRCFLQSLINRYCMTTKFNHDPLEKNKGITVPVLDRVQLWSAQACADSLIHCD
jgi:hypothetical protein